MKLRQSFYILCLCLFVGLGLCACGRDLSPQKACGFNISTNQRLRVSWKSQGVTMHVHSSVDSRFHEEIRDAARTWNEVLKTSYIRIVMGETGWNEPSSPSQDGRSTIHSLTSWNEDKSAQQAVTTSYWRGSSIFEADISLNDKDFDFFVSDESGRRKVHLLSLMIHEMGHVLGLVHNDSSSSVMRPYLESNTQRVSLGEDDINAIYCEYVPNKYGSSVQASRAQNTNGFVKTLMRILGRP